MNGWKEVLSVFAVTISVGLLIGMLLLINSTKRSTRANKRSAKKKLPKPNHNKAVKLEQRLQAPQ